MKKKIIKITGNLITILSAIFLIWIIASWMNVLAHNDPWRGDKKYAPNNAFVVLEKMDMKRNGVFEK